jgi:tryptophan 2,3-dioxygenase
MEPNAANPEVSEVLRRLGLLEEKYSGLGQDLLAYLEGLYYSHGLTYWDYIHLDSLLGLQMPRTPLHDEMIFIVYHQMTELSFKLVKWELGALADEEGEWREPERWRRRLSRAVNYFRHLSSSFDIMLSGLDPEEMRKFRMALLPASGFQSVQFREIEIMSSSLDHLLRVEAPPESASLEELYPFIYWKQGGIDLHLGHKTLTLKHFEEKYDEHLLALLRKYETRNLDYRYRQAPEAVRQDPEIRKLLRSYDLHVNVFWKLSHLSAAARHLVSGGADIEATGGTNWRSFLPPRFQRIQFFPYLWSEEERADWGKAGVLKQFQAQVARHWQEGEAHGA